MAEVTEAATLTALAIQPELRGSVLRSGAATLMQRTGFAGDLVQPARMIAARALSSTRIRLDFDGPLDDTSILRDPASYLIEAAGFGTVPFVAAVDVPDVLVPRFVELRTSEMTNLAPYSARVKPLTVESAGVPVASDALPFDGIGVGPILVVAIAVSPVAVEIRFNESLKELSLTLDAAAYLFTGGLIVEAVEGVSDDTIILRTSEQSRGEMYSLTVNAVVVDHAWNPMTTPSETDVLGFEPKPDDEPGAIQMYDFLVEALRVEDQKSGALLRRFLEGPQRVWEGTLRTALDLPTIWSVEGMPDDALTLQQTIVGWTDRLRGVTDRLSPLALRRVVASSVKFWQERGAEDSTVDALRLFTGARARILNWFDFRWILGETHFGIENDGSDPWLLSSPFDGGNDDAQVYNIRIVDDGSLDRELVRSVVSLTRPTGEQAEITYLALLDLFDVDGDDSQWRSVLGPPGTVAGGRLAIGPLAVMLADVDGASRWAGYVVRARVRGTGAFGVGVYVSGPLDGYAVAIDLVFGYFVIYKTTAGFRTDLRLRPIESALNGPLHPDVFYGVQVEVVPSGTGTSIRLFVDGEKVAEAWDDDHVSGTVAFGVQSGTVEVDSVEVFFVPAPTESVGLEN
jgi:hypothetical protein